MKYIRFIMIGLAFVFLIYVIFVIYQNTAKKSEQNIPIPTNQEQTNKQQWEPKTDDQASVNVVVTPVNLSRQSTEWEFDIVMDTHSVELNQDMTQNALLIGDDNKEYRPIKWNGPVGGHHREGTLTFNPIMPAPKSITLKITGIGNVVRSFSWQFK